MPCFPTNGNVGTSAEAALHPRLHSSVKGKIGCNWFERSHPNLAALAPQFQLSGSRPEAWTCVQQRVPTLQYPGLRTAGFGPLKTGSRDCWPAQNPGCDRFVCTELKEIQCPPSPGSCPLKRCLPR